MSSSNANFMNFRGMDQNIPFFIIKLALAHDMTGLIDSFNIILFSLFHSTLKSARVTQKRKFQNFHKAQI
jgi:hypothetical protein